MVSRIAIELHELSFCPLIGSLGSYDPVDWLPQVVSTMRWLVSISLLFCLLNISQLSDIVLQQTTKTNKQKNSCCSLFTNVRFRVGFSRFLHGRMFLLYARSIFFFIFFLSFFLAGFICLLKSESRYILVFFCVRLLMYFYPLGLSQNYWLNRNCVLTLNSESSDCFKCSFTRQFL